MKPITAVVLGAGNRGSVYGSFAKACPGELQVVALAEPRADRLGILADELNIPESGRFTSWQELLESNFV